MIVGIVFEEIVQGYAAKIAGGIRLLIIRRTDEATGFAARAFDYERGFLSRGRWSGRNASGF